MTVTIRLNSNEYNQLIANVGNIPLRPIENNNPGDFEVVLDENMPDQGIIKLSDAYLYYKNKKES